MEAQGYKLPYQSTPWLHRGFDLIGHRPQPPSFLDVFFLDANFSRKTKDSKRRGLVFSTFHDGACRADATECWNGLCPIASIPASSLDTAARSNTERWRDLVRTEWVNLC